jgi:formamidopyrimidine-DNA glycosylase
MPELPEVEQFRRMLLPLTISSSSNRPDDSGEHNVSIIDATIRLFLPTDPSIIPPRQWITHEDVTKRLLIREKGDNDDSDDTNSCYCLDVLRQGKQLCMMLMVAERKKNVNNDGTKKGTSHNRKKTVKKDDENRNHNRGDSIFHYHYYALLLHMGMTGEIVTPAGANGLGLGSLSKNRYMTANHNMITSSLPYPPKHTYLMFTNLSSGYQAAFCDPRKFGSSQLLSLDVNVSFSWNEIESIVSQVANVARQVAFADLAPDAWLSDSSTFDSLILPKFLTLPTTMGIKAALLDQKRIMSGVGNWIADEVLYQCQIHPEQRQLRTDEIGHLFSTLQQILQIAIDCLNRNDPYPSSWLFPYRWTNKKAGCDSLGRTITFLTAAGRTSAIVNQIQKLQNRAKNNQTNRSQNKSTEKIRNINRVETIVTNHSEYNVVNHFDSACHHDPVSSKNNYPNRKRKRTEPKSLPDIKKTSNSQRIVLDEHMKSKAMTLDHGLLSSSSILFSMDSLVRSIDTGMPRNDESNIQRSTPTSDQNAMTKSRNNASTSPTVRRSPRLITPTTSIC